MLPVAQIIIIMRFLAGDMHIWTFWAIFCILTIFMKNASYLEAVALASHKSMFDLIKTLKAVLIGSNVFWQRRRSYLSPQYCPMHSWPTSMAVMKMSSFGCIYVYIYIGWSRCKFGPLKKRFSYLCTVSFFCTMFTCPRSVPVRIFKAYTAGKKYRWKHSRHIAEFDDFRWKMVQILIFISNFLGNIDFFIFSWKSFVTSKKTSSDIKARFEVLLRPF